MKELICRGCNNELDSCICNVLTTEKEQAVKLKPIVVYNPCIQCEFEHDGECFDIECHSNTRYNASVLGAKEQLETDQLVVNDLVTHIVGLKGQIEGYQGRIKDLERINTSHRIENGKLRERIKELEEQLNSTRLQINGTESIKLFMNGEKTVFVKVEETALNKDEAEALLLALESYMFCLYGTKKLPDWAAKLQKIIDKRG